MMHLVIRVSTGRAPRAAGLVVLWSVALAALIVGCATTAGAPPELRFLPAGALAGHEEAVLEVALSPSGRLLASASLDDTVRLWDLGSGQEVRSFEHPDDVYSVAFHPSGELIGTACRDGLIRLFRIEGDEPPLELAGNSLAAYAVAFSPDGMRVASAGEDLSLRIWDVATGESLRVLTGHAEKVQDVAFSPDGTLLASASSDKSIRLWRGSDGGLAKVLRIQNISRQVSEMTVCFSADSTHLLSAGARGSSDERPAVREWSVAEKRPVRSFQGHTQDIWDVKYLRSGEYVAAAGREGIVYFWSVVSGGLLGKLDAKGGAIWSFVQSKDQSTIYVATAKRGILIFRLAQ